MILLLQNVAWDFTRTRHKQKSDMLAALNLHAVTHICVHCYSDVTRILRSVQKNFRVVHLVVCSQGFSQRHYAAILVCQLLLKQLDAGLSSHSSSLLFLHLLLQLLHLHLTCLCNHSTPLAAGTQQWVMGTQLFHPQPPDQMGLIVSQSFRT